MVRETLRTATQAGPSLMMAVAFACATIGCDGPERVAQDIEPADGGFGEEEDRLLLDTGIGTGDVGAGENEEIGLDDDEFGTGEDDLLDGGWLNDDPDLGEREVERIGD